MLKGEDHLTKRQYVHAATNTTSTITPIATTFKGSTLKILLALLLVLPILQL